MTAVSSQQKASAKESNQLFSLVKNDLQYRNRSRERCKPSVNNHKPQSMFSSRLDWFSITGRQSGRQRTAAIELTHAVCISNFKHPRSCRNVDHRRAAILPAVRGEPNARRGASSSPGKLANRIDWALPGRFSVRPSQAGQRDGGVWGTFLFGGTINTIGRVSSRFPPDVKPKPWASAQRLMIATFLITSKAGI